MSARPKKLQQVPADHIELVGGKLHEIVDEAEQALLDGDFGLYQRGGMIVRPAIVPITVSDGGKAEALQLVQETAVHLTETLTRAAKWMKFDARAGGLVAKDCPDKVAKTYLDRVGAWRLPVLCGIVSAPTLRPDGSILSEPGYDKSTGFLFDPQGATFPAVPVNPSRDDAIEAQEKLLKIVRGFSFVSKVDESVFLSLVLTSLVRRSLPTAPGHGITAPVAGSGKSMLVDIATIIATGRRCSVISQGKNQEETEKKLVGVLVSGDQIMSLDNCNEPLDGDLLCQMLTQEIVKPRILGKTGNPECLTNFIIAATGKNLRMKGDQTRRWLLCSLDAGVERPEDRVFTFDAKMEALEQRPELAVGALTMMRAYLASGETVANPPLGSFTEWSKLVRNTLIWLNDVDPVRSMEIIRDEDPERTLLEAFIEQHHTILKTRVVSAREIIEKTEEFIGDGEKMYPEFHETVGEICLGRAGLSVKVLGKWLASNVGRPVRGLAIAKERPINGIQMWSVKQPLKRKS